MIHTFRLLWLIALIGLVIFATGCSAEEIESLKEKNQELQNKIADLEDDNGTLSEKMDTKTAEYEQLRKEMEQIIQVDQTSGYRDFYFTQELESEIALYQEEINKLLEFIEDGDQRMDSIHLLNMFNPMFVQEGDIFAGLKVTSVTKEENDVSHAYNYFIEFTGDFKVSGRISLNQIGSGYVFCVNSEDIFKAPYTYYDRINKNLCFTIKNAEDIERAVGEELTEMEYEEPIALTAIFSNYKFNFVPETDVQDQASFVKLVEE